MTTTEQSSPATRSAMTHRAIHCAALLLAGWTMGLEFAHVLEWAPKAGYPSQLYVHLQESLYLWFGNVGGAIYILAIVAAAVLWILRRRDRVTRRLAATATVLELAALAVFLTVVYPVNFQFPVHGSGAVPQEWESLRNRWEIGHAVGFALFSVAFILLAAGALAYNRATRENGAVNHR